eukprot:3403550-Rhodomonas_salina.1
MSTQIVSQFYKWLSPKPQRSAEVTPVSVVASADICFSTSVPPMEPVRDCVEECSFFDIPATPFSLEKDFEEQPVFDIADGPDFDFVPVPADDLVPFSCFALMDTIRTHELGPMVCSVLFSSQCVHDTDKIWAGKGVHHDTEFADEDQLSARSTPPGSFRSWGEEIASSASSCSVSTVGSCNSDVLAWCEGQTDTSFEHGQYSHRSSNYHAHAASRDAERSAQPNFVCAPKCTKLSPATSKNLAGMPRVLDATAVATFLPSGLASVTNFIKLGQEEGAVVTQSSATLEIAAQLSCLGSEWAVAPCSVGMM